MKRMGVLGGISAQATMDFEARVHRTRSASSRSSGTAATPRWSSGITGARRPHRRRRPAGRAARDRSRARRGRALARQAVEFIVIPCNAAHVGVHAIREAAGCPVLSMIDVTIDEVVRRRCRRIGVMGFAGAPAGYLEPMGQRGIGCAEIPLLLDRDDVTDLINPASLLAEAAVRYATDE